MKILEIYITESVSIPNCTLISMIEKKGPFSKYNNHDLFADIIYKIRYWKSDDDEFFLFKKELDPTLGQVFERYNIKKGNAIYFSLESKAIKIDFNQRISEITSPLRICYNINSEPIENIYNK